MQQISFRKDVLPLKDKLFRIALRITLNREESEDIVQDALIRIWDKRDEWKDLRSVEAFALVVAKNLAIDKMQKKENQTLGLTVEYEAKADTENPYERLVGNERIHLVHKLINRLPEKQRLIMQLRDIEEKNYKEIAHILNLTEEQVKVNLFRARQKVKQWYLEINDYGL